ncbi:MAG: hypothetical protein LBH70_00365 [Spirochaetaceae bacterium]|nr:hypothetical protein [Spirochaetaceae bacterium]
MNGGWGAASTGFRSGLRYQEAVRSGGKIMPEQPDASREQEESKAGPGGGEPDRDIVFHYSRERRLARASQTVRDLYDTSPASRPTLYKAFTGGTRAGAVLLITIVMVSFILLFLSRDAGERGGASLAGNAVAVSALGFPARDGKDAAAYLTVIKKTTSERAYTGPVDVAVSVYQHEGGVGEEPPIAAQRIFFTLEPEEDFRFSVPFTGPELILIFRAGEELASFRVKPE